MKVKVVVSYADESGEHELFIAACEPTSMSHCENVANALETAKGVLTKVGHLLDSDSENEWTTGAIDKDTGLVTVTDTNKKDCN